MTGPLPPGRHACLQREGWLVLRARPQRVWLFILQVVRAAGKLAVDGRLLRDLERE